MQRLHNYWSNFLENRMGNFALLFALSAPVVLAAIGVGFDIARLVNQRTVLQNGLDAASLASVSALAAKDKTTDNIRPYAIGFLTAQLAGQIPADQVAALVESATVTAKKKTVGTKAVYTMSMAARVTETLTPFSALLGHRTADIAAQSSTSSEVTSTALSLYLVVDRSGSMSYVTDTVLSSPSSCQNYRTDWDWNRNPWLPATSPCHLNKMGALKKAAKELFDKVDNIEDDDTSNSVTRTGVVSFNDSQQSPSDITWGTTASRAYITNLPGYPTGGTDMSTPMDTAYRAVTSTAEAAAQSAHGNTKVQKYIVLMTDGENTSGWRHADWLDVRTMTACEAAKDAGVTIYAVAFKAPDAGKALLLACSGSESNFYMAEDTNGLVAAFDDIGRKIGDRATRLTN
jgi:Flp pilus assembly protein TadG